MKTSHSGKVEKFYLRLDSIQQDQSFCTDSKFESKIEEVIV